MLYIQRKHLKQLRLARQSYKRTAHYFRLCGDPETNLEPPLPFTVKFVQTIHVVISPPSPHLRGREHSKQKREPLIPPTPKIVKTSLFE